jgi:P4 family phage/plasmid primase-like protien
VNDARTFLDALWPLGIPEGSHLVITTQIPGERVCNYKVEDTYRGTVHQDRHVWVNVAARRLGTEARGRTEDLTWIPALWADLDVEEGAPEGVHRTGSCFETRAAAMDFLMGFPVKPSMIVSTGYGYSAWWILGEPETAAAAEPILAALKATVMRLSEGRTDPAVYDTARMMRLPGTMNVKVPEAPQPCEIVSTWPARYSLADLAEILDLPPAPPTHEHAPATHTPAGVGRPGDDYDEQATTEQMVALLVEHGCVETHRYWKGEAGSDSDHGRLVVQLARPGKDPRSGHSMTVGYIGPAVTHMFSSGWEELPPDTYRPYRLYGYLEHGGDMLAAIRALAAAGYGRQLVTLDKLPDLNGLAIAEDFAAWAGDGILWVEGLEWHIWDGARYVNNSAGVRRLLTTYVKALKATALDDLNKAADDAEKKAALAKVKKAETWMERTPRMRVLEDVADIISIPPSELDTDPELLNVSNGIVNLRTGELIPHDPQYLMTKMAEAEYDPQATSADWEKTLGAVTDDVRDWLQVAIGMSATGYVSADQIYVAHGPGGDGKTTLLGAVADVLGNYGHRPQSDLFTHEGHGKTMLLMPLRGARFVLAAETGADHFLNMERLKALSGGDAITDRKLYGQYITWKPSHALWLMTNHRPRVRSTDEGTWRRLLLIPFPHGATFRANPDIGLRDRLARQAENRAAVLTWIVKGATRWFTADCKLPACMDIELLSRQWRDEEDVIGSFVTDRYEVTGESQDAIRASDLYEDYRLYCEANGIRPLSAKNLKGDMDRLAEKLSADGMPGIAHGRDKHGAYWRGLRKLANVAGGFGFSPPAPEPEDERSAPW